MSAPVANRRAAFHDFERPDPGLVEGFREILDEYSPSCLLADALVNESQSHAGILGNFRTVRPEHRVVGPVLTVRMAVDELADCPTLLCRAQPGDVVLLACQGQTGTAMWGGLMSTLAKKVGIAGCVVDGSVRDVDEIRDLDFPVWYRDTTPRPSPTAVHGRAEPVEVNAPVVVQGQVINPGDIIVADENGIAVVASAKSADILAVTRENIGKEELIRTKIDSGISVADLLAEFGHM